MILCKRLLFLLYSICNISVSWRTIRWAKIRCEFSGTFICICSLNSVIHGLYSFTLHCFQSFNVLVTVACLWCCWVPLWVVCAATLWSGLCLWRCRFQRGVERLLQRLDEESNQIKAARTSKQQAYSGRSNSFREMTTSEQSVSSNTTPNEWSVSSNATSNERSVSSNATSNERSVSSNAGVVPVLLSTYKSHCGDSAAVGVGDSSDSPTQSEGFISDLFQSITWWWLLGWPA